MKFKCMVCLPKHPCILETNYEDMSLPKWCPFAIRIHPEWKLKI